MNLICFELKKTWQSRKTFSFILLAFLLTTFLFFFNVYLGQREDEQIKAQIGSKQSVMNQTEFNDTIKAFLEETNQGILDQEEDFRTATDKGESLEGKLTLPTYPFYRQALNEALLKRKLPPQSMRYGTNNSIFSAILLSYLASFFGIFLLLLLFGDSLSKEIEENNLSFIFSQPTRRTRVFFIKYGLALVQAILAVFVLLLFGFILASILSGSSDLTYPVVVFTQRSMKFISVIYYVGQVLALFVFVLAFCFALHFLLSVLLKKTNLTLVMTMFILLEGYAVSTLNNKFIQKVASLNPFTYLNVSKIFIGYDFRSFELFSIENQEYYANWCLPRTMHNGQINSLNGIISLSIATIILLVLGCFCFKKNRQY
ncbi:ABC transporter permease subunit [Candidatus Enterococcus mansonii]|uniref:ABC transporter permease n=1 Tax=Candidatus Enterococcus mansonii TaxID=1834181 RepID=A0A242CI95_9ENTE|nr:ABC transporter permease subunit [Enterococcus sp. 4G2_DIV0659]OTO09931.1 hypothetical protein A5880_000614 [Enterococcus sp. 4G2_DIV0659]